MSKNGNSSSQVGRADLEELLQMILPKLDRGGSPDNKWPDRKGEYWPLCPYHLDHKPGTFGVSVRGYHCFSCGAQGGLYDLAKHLGVAPLHRCTVAGGVQGISISLQAYADAKHLPAEYLTGLGVTERKHRGRSALRIAYYDQDGQEVVLRWRLALSGDKRFEWASGSAGKLVPYGLWRLSEVAKDAPILLVEGESDAHTLWYHGVPALGIPGAGMWQPEWAVYLEGHPVYLWREPDEGGGQFVDKVGQSRPDVQVIYPPDSYKDISEAHILGCDVPAVLSELMAAARPYQEIRAEQLSQEAAEAKETASALLASSDILAELVRTCRGLGLVGEDRNARLLYLALTSRLLDKPVSIVVKGPSSAGKSYITDTILKLMPSTAYYALSSMSERALAYSQEPLSHRFLVLYEAAGMAGDFSTYLMRTLLSEGRIRYETVDKTAGGLEPRLLERPGPTGLLLTTTGASLHPENETRMFSLSVRDDREQTRLILQALALAVNEEEAEQPDLSPWLALQTWLELAGARNAQIPYANELAQSVSPNAVRLRRDLTRIFSLIQAHALLHQEMRERDAKGRVVATLNDYRAVYELVSDLVDEGVEATVSSEVRETVEAVARLAGGTGRFVGLVELSQYLDLGKPAVSRRVRVAEDLGYIVNMQDRKGKPALLQVGEPMPSDRAVLPTPEELERNKNPSYPSRNAATVQRCNTTAACWPIAEVETRDERWAVG